MRKKLLSVLLVAAALPLFIPFSGLAGQTEGTIYLARPRLIVMLVIDQFRYDYLVHFRPYFVASGFNLLLAGADFIDCRYDYAITATCPGHSTLFTGAYADIHGIVGNEWWDAAAHQSVYCAADPSVQIVGATGPGMSPRNLTVSTIGDELRMATGFESKVIAISLKDRASIMPGGHLANAAYWYDPKTGRFVTSTYYLAKLPDWVAAFNAELPTKAYCGQDWRALPETPGANREIFRKFAPAPGEPCPDERFTEWLDNTPVMNEIELNFALAAIRGEHLGSGPGTDLLAVSLSVNDYVGHAYGPYSEQVADTTLRTDRYLAEFFHRLDQTIGLSHVWITLSADHGVAPNPRYIRQHHLGMGNFPVDVLEQRVNEALNQVFGQDHWVDKFGEFYISLDRNTLKKHGLDLTKAAEVAAQAAASSPGVRAAFTRQQFLTGALPHTDLARKAAHSFNPQRSGDVFLILEPYAVPVTGETGTTHGSPWNYDAQVPLVLWGSAFKPGIYAAAVQPIDLAPTLAAALGISQPSGAQGRPLTQALAAPR